MDRLLIVDHEKCTGCLLCELACSVKHTGQNNPSHSRIHVLKWPMQGFELPMVCLQCENAPCVAACPKAALYRDPHMYRVTWNPNACIGCKMCVMVCPFGAIGVDGNTQQVIKCDLCDGDPICVRFCVPGALQFRTVIEIDRSKQREVGFRLFETMAKSYTAISHKDPP
ncbi:MAG: 4Fe-4S dicluster domain-containing protein [Anaerolineales bacterium]|nr:4Fe-4S dicluster domain-containing protein [Anaerolineales bacterium]